MHLWSRSFLGWVEANRSVPVRLLVSMAAACQFLSYLTTWGVEMVLVNVQWGRITQVKRQRDKQTRNGSFKKEYTGYSIVVGEVSFSDLGRFFKF